jgi:coenzyme F420-0:L-glutamate ligase/coenzyme F420-1:gamma-L-glutamate ligase
VITRTRHGLVCANAGVDASNVAPGFLTLLPEDPDASAERVQKELVARFGLARLGLVVTDTFGRPWREGVVDVAIGCAGLPALLDLRGTTDDRGAVLETTVVALADAVAAASGLVMTKTARVPAALVRGLDATVGNAPPGPARALVRAPADDLFRESVPVAVAAARSGRAFGEGPVSRELLEEAIVAASSDPGPSPRSFVALDSAASRRRLLAVVDDPAEVLRAAPVLVVPCVGASDASEQTTLLAAGGAIRSLVIALRGLGLASSWEPDVALDPDRARAALALDPDLRPIGIVAVGRMPEGGA